MSTRYCGSKDASTGLCTGCADDCGGIWDHWKSEVSALGGIWYVEIRELCLALLFVEGGLLVRAVSYMPALLLIPSYPVYSHYKMAAISLSHTHTHTC